jgi:histidinol-phosphate aminotransferase
MENLTICPHGGINHAELSAMGIDPEALIDFSVCTNPFLPQPNMRQIRLGDVSIEQYPDSETTELRQRLSEKHSVPPDNILVGSGTTELIRLIALAYFRQGDIVLIPEPTYGEYEVAVNIAGAKPLKHWMRAEDNFAPRIKDFVGLIDEQRPKAIFICNPNNPTGKYLSRQEIESILAAAGNGLLVLDEAYLAFVDQSWPSIDLITKGNVAILRSMTKDYALAGLRLGYAIASKGIIDNLRRVCPPWNVSVIAQRAGVMALDGEDYLEQSKLKIREAKGLLTDGLSRLGFELLPSDAHYFLVKVGKAQEFRISLLRHGIQVRDGTSLGLPEYIRIAPRTLPECRKLIDVVGKLKEKGELGTSDKK